MTYFQFGDADAGLTTSLLNGERAEGENARGAHVFRAPQNALIAVCLFFTLVLGVASAPAQGTDAGFALNFAGGSLEVPHQPAFTNLPLSVSLWVRTTTQSGTIFSMGGAGFGENGFSFSLGSGFTFFRYGRDDFISLSGGGGAIGDGQWHHVVVSWDDDNGPFGLYGAEIFVDGAQAGGGTWDFDPGHTTTNAPLRFHGFTGQIDEVAIWSAPLRAGTVAGLWNRRLAGTEPRLVALYHFDETNAMTAVDASGHVNGQILGSANRIASTVPLQDLLTIAGRVVPGVTALATNAVPIPDLSTVESPVEITAVGIANGVKVNVDITHTYRGDMILTLIHPDGTEVILHDREGGAAQNLVTSYPDLTAPAQSLAALNGKPITGIWRLRVTDAAAADEGRINGWSLEPGLTLSSTTPPIQVTAQLAPFNVTIGLGPIPDQGSRELVARVGAFDRIGLVKVDVGITHTFRGDLEITLIHPDGTEVRLKDADPNDDRPDVTALYPDDTAPAQSLATLNGKSMFGDWRLRVRDAFAQDVGELDRFILTLGPAPVFTDASGQYVLSNLYLTSYLVRPVLAGSTFTPPERTVLAGSSNVNFFLSSGAIAGRVTDGGAGVAGVRVSVGGLMAVTDANGFYRVEMTTPGTNAVVPSLAGHGFSPVQLSVSAGTTNANFTVASYPVSGRVVDLRTNAAPGVTVRAGGSQIATTDADGNYLIGQVPPGVRTITPSRAGALFNPPSRSVSVRPAVTGVDFTLASAPPTISDIRDRVIAKGSTTGGIRFDVDDTETRAGLLALTAASSNTNLVPPAGIVFGGVGNARTVSITPRSDASGIVTITVTVTDESGLSASDSFALRVNTPPLAGLGSALNFDGVNDSVLVNTNALDNKGTFTVECWAFAPSNAGPRTLAAQGSSTNIFSLGVGANGNVRVSGVWDTGVPFPFGGWHHLAVVKEISNARLYVDGLLRATRGSTIPLPSRTNRFDIGRSPAGEFWLGSLDELRVWDAALNAAQIATNLNARPLGNETNLVALWRFDERSGNTTADQTPFARHGAVNGATWVQSGARFNHYLSPEDVEFSDRLQAFDPDGDPLVFRLITPATLGVVTLTDTNTGAFTYTPNANVFGEDRFSFSVNDGYAESEISLVAVTLSPDTNAPTFTWNFFDTHEFISEDGSVLATLRLFDPETRVDRLTLTAFSSNPILLPVENVTFGPGNVAAERTMNVAPARDQNGTVTLTVVLSDGRLTSTNTIFFTVTPVNDPPVISGLTNQIVRRGGTTAPQPFTVRDIDNEVGSLTVTAVSGTPALTPTVTVGGSGSNRTVSVTAAASQSGSATITVTVGDGQFSTLGTFTVIVDEPPTIAAIPAQTTFKNTPTRPIAITLGDVDNTVAGLTLTASSSDTRLIPNNAFTFGGNGANRTLVVTPAPGTVGAATVTVTVSDAIFSVSTNFALVVEEGLDYTYVELPLPPGMEGALALDLNDSGLVVGRGYFPAFAGDRAVAWDVNSVTATVRLLSNLQSDALAVNNAGQIVGSAGGGAVIFENNSVTTLTNTGRSYAFDINDAGMVVGTTDTIGHSMFFYDGTRRTNFAGIFQSGFAIYGISVVKLNSRGDVFGISTDNTSALLWQLNGDGSRTLRNLGAFGSLLAGGFNNVGEVAFSGSQSDTLRQLVYNHRNNAVVTNLASAFTNLFGNSLELIADLNDASEMVGGRVFGPAQGFLYSDGFVRKLTDLVPTNVFSPSYGTALNRAGDICGYGFKPGSSGVQPFLLRRQVLVGQPLSPPVGAINPATQRAFQKPQVVAIDGTPAEQVVQATLWSDLEQKLFFLRPFAARVTWLTTSDLSNTNPPPPVVRTMRAVFPADPQIHIAGAPVNVEPLGVASPYRAVALAYTTVPDAAFDTGTKALTVNQPGFSVIHYLIAPEAALGSTPNALTHSNHFQVVRTVPWNDANFLSNNLPATVGTAVADPRGPQVSTNSPRSGWVVFERAPYDGVGAERAYERGSQTGPIIPVNTETIAGSDPLVVAFYRVNPKTGALWPDLPARFTITWPTNASRLVIADRDGSGPLPPAQFPEKRIYNQPDRALPGFNPNEEHAFFAPSAPGEGVFALRNDLNRATTSRNFVLLKYRHPASGEWRMKPYEVVLEDAAHGFTFHGEAGKEILPPYPLSLFPICAGENQTRVISGAAFRDHRGKFYAKMGDTLAEPNPQVVIRYFYQLQLEFFYDLNGDRLNDLPPGTCIEWQGIKPGAGAATPVDVTYRIHWPVEAPTLQIGETLLNAKGGLPAIRNFANAQVVFDTLNPDGTMPLAATARLYDPLSARVLAITNVPGISASYRFPPEIALATQTSGKQLFSDLPFYLRSRLSYDPVNRWLSWSGFLNDNVLGEPLLLINVISRTERDRIKQLSSEANFQSIVDALYDLTRNPNRVNVSRPGQQPPTPDLLIGFTTEYVARVTNGVPPNATTTLQSFFGIRPTGVNIAVIVTNVAQEPLGDLPKALTAGLPVPPSNPSFGKAASFNGNNGYIDIPADVFNFPTTGTTNAPLTFECWFKTTAGGAILGQQNGSPFTALAGGYVPAIYIGTDGKLRVELFWKGVGNPITSEKIVTDGVFHHLAVVYDGATETVYLDGVSAGSAPHVQTAYAASYRYQIGTCYTLNWQMGNSNWFNFNGLIDDLRIWTTARSANEIVENMFTPLTGLETGLAAYYRFDEPTGSLAIDTGAATHDATFALAAARATSTVPIPAGTEAPRYLVIAENNDPALGALPVTLHVIRVEGGPFRGDLKVLFPDNVFDERLTLRHSSDFGGDPDRLQFEWWYHPDDADFDPVALPIVNPASGQIIDARGWRVFRPPTAGENSLTIGDGAETSLFTLIDNWFIVRYRGYNIAGSMNWSDWVGDPSSAADTRAAFAPGWVKRVVEGINPFEARTTNFHDNASVTYASMLIQAGERYEGDIALNPSGGNLNNIGLIEAYSTVLNRGRNLSIDGLPPVDSDPANNALLLAASRLADLYTLIGNEAFSDAQDPTIGFFSDSLEFGTVATSIFAYQNQLDSLLEEELALLRGRDDSASGVGARPVYNRLLWNFTGAEGEVAYERVYNVGDVNLDGVINENDARILFPQGHGDAWGHYLTAAKTYYELLRHPRFTWIPRTENVLVAGTAVRVDFLDERKFAAIAAQKAKTGAEIVDLTYRSKYVDNPEGQYQGYKDTRPDRAWGVTEWARRAGQGAYFDWLVGNAILPSTDPNTNHIGIQKIDRQTVLELEEVISHHREVQAQVDEVDKGLNPIGLAKGVVPFDIDPSLLLPSSGVQAQGHFEQIYNRAVQAMNNTVTMWNQANSLTEALRRQQDTVDEFTANVTDQERDFKSRLLEIFGYPYAGDIGAGKTYPSGYEGPDLYHYNYVAATELTGAQPSPRGLKTAYFAPFQDGTAGPSFYFGNDLSTPNIATHEFLTVTFPLTTGDWAFTAPSSYGARRAPGEIQLAISDLLQEETRLKIALNNYDGLIQQIEDMATLLESRLALSNRTITLLTANRTQQTTLNTQITAAHDAQLALRRISSIITRFGDAAVTALPEDPGDAVWFMDEVGGAIINVVSIVASEALEVGADIAEGQQNRFEKTKEQTQLQTDIDVEVASQDFEVKQMAAELRQLLRSEPPMRLEALNQAELIKQSLGRYQAALAAGQRLVAERAIFRQRTAGLAQQNRYKDIAFRIFRNDALQKYRAQFDLAVRYVYLAASAYDYELNFLGDDTRGARDFFTDIIRQRSLGVMVGGIPITGRTGLSDPLARLKQNFEVLSPRFGLNNPQQETARFSLRKELFRIRDGNDEQWRKLLTDAVVADLWEVPEFRRYCRPFAPEPAGPQPGLVLRFPTTVTFGLNFFEHALGGGDTAYDPSLFSTKINAVGVWFSDYNNAGLATAPRVYLFPVGMDVMRSPTGNTLATREYKILDQVVPVPFPIGASDVDDPTWIPINDSLAESFAQIRRYSSFRAYHDLGVYEESQSTKDTRLVGRSVWNTDWVLIIPGGTFLNDPKQGLERFIDSVSDILISLQSYSYSGD